MPHTQKHILTLVRQHTLAVLSELDIEQIKDTDVLIDLGANSVDRAEIISLTLESLALDIPRVGLFEATTPGELAQRIAEQQAHA